jgi:hypothetical protein
MEKFRIKPNSLIPYNYNINKVSFNKDRTMTARAWRIVQSSKYNGTVIAHFPEKQISNL